MNETVCLVTGGAGFIGSNLVRALVRAGRRVRVLDNFATGHRENLQEIESEVELIEGDIRDWDCVRRAVRQARYVFHLAALPSVIRSIEDPLATHDVNITGTLNLLLQARDAGVERLIFSSSCAVYGDAPEFPKTEEMLPCPLSPYALSKLAGEHYGRLAHELYGLQTYALRYFNVFGPAQDPASHYAAAIPLFIRALLRGKPPVVYGDGEQTRDFIFVDNVVRANLACCEAPAAAAGAVYNIGTGVRTSVNRLLGTLADMLHSDVAPVHQPARPGDIRDSQADIRRARAGLGWEPAVGFADGLRATLEWYGAAGAR